MTCAIITCSGVSNVGKLTTQAAQVLLQRKMGQYVWIHARQSTVSMQQEIRDVDKLIVINGCIDCCATKKLSSSRIAPHHHIIATELGIEKKGMAEVQYEDIEKVVHAIMDIGSEQE